MIAFCLVLQLLAAPFDEAMTPRSGDIERAAASRMEIANDPGNPLGYYGLALALYQMGRNEQALAVYDRMLELRFEQATPHYIPSDRGVVLLRLGRHDEARAAFEEALALNPSFGHAHFNLAVLIIRTGGDPNSIFDHIEAAKADDSDQQAAFYDVYRGAALFRLKRYEEARTVLEAAVAAMPREYAPFNYPCNDCEALYEGRYYLALTLNALGRHEAAQRQFLDIFALREARLKALVPNRASNRPTGNWPCYEDPDRFVSLFHLWDLPEP